MIILPCPFCGKYELGVESTDIKLNLCEPDKTTVFFVECDECGYRAPYNEEEWVSITMHNMISRQIIKN